MIVLMFSVDTKFSDDTVAKLLSGKATTLACRLGDAVEDVLEDIFIPEHEWDTCGVRCELMQTLYKV